MLNLTTTGALASFEVRNQSYTPRSTTCPPNFVPPGSLPMPSAPVPAGMSWECHAQRTSANATVRVRVGVRVRVRVKGYGYGYG